VVHNNCTAFDEASFFYNKPPTAQFTVDYDEGCSPLKVEFTNNTVGAKSYLWDFGDGAGYGKTDTSHTYINDENLDTAFKVTLKAISVKGCMDTIYLLISVHTLPEIGISAQPLTQEFPSSTVFIENLSGDGEVNYIWDFGDGKFSQEKNPVNHKYTTWGTYTIKLEMRSDFCSKESSENVTIAPPVPDCEFSFLGAGCEPFDVEFKNLNAPNNAASYSWDFGDKSELSSEASPKHTYELAGSYTVTLTANGYGGQTCTKSDTVEVYPLPFADFEINPSEVMIPHAVHFFNYSTHADSVQWDFGDKATGIDSIANVKNPVYKYTTVGTYSVLLQVWSKYGCYDSAKMVNAIFVKEAGELIFPTAFTPNTSGSNGGAYPANVRERELNNDIFYPVARGIDVYNLKIYNRWGVLIFESFDLYVGWDGYSNSKLCSQDAYIWKATGKYKSGQSFEKSGSVTLVR